MFNISRLIFILNLVVFKTFSQVDSANFEWLNRFAEVSMKIEENIEIDPNGPPIYLVPAKDTVRATDTIRYNVFFGSDEKEAEGVYGLTMKWRHETVEVFGGNNMSSFNGCWLGTDGIDMMTLSVSKDDGIDIAMSRIDQVNRNGRGYLATIDIVTPDNLVEKVNDIDIRLTDISIVSFKGDTLIPNYIEPEKVILVSSKKLENKNVFTIAPNPSNGIFKLKSNVKINHLEVVDLTGRLVFSMVHVASNQNIDLLGLPKGMYILKAYSYQGLYKQQIHLK